MTYRLHHIHLICEDLEEMIHFFSEVLGADLLERKKVGGADAANLDLQGTPINIRVAREDEKVIEDTIRSPYGFNHIGLEVENLEAAHKELTSKGFVFSVPPRDVGSMKIAFFNGPENLTLELVEPRH